MRTPNEPLSARRGPWLRLWKPALALLALLLLLPLLPTSGTPPAQAQAPINQMRAFWVPAHASGFHNHVQVDELVNNVVRANANTIIIQMRRHGDAWYNRGSEPRAIYPGLAPANEFDPLEYVIAKAHERGIKVHAWLVVSVVCRRYDPLYGHPDHVCTEHGPEAEGVQRWTTGDVFGNQVGNLDYGHPGSIIYFESVVQDLIRDYPQVDGIHLDFIRYAGRETGYNQVSLDRFRSYYGFPADYRPQPTDEAWSQWRRDRVTELVRRVYVRSKAIKPTIEISIAAITWGGLGTYSPDDWPNSAAYDIVYQDWKGWLDEGIIDFAVPMKYFEEGTSRTRGWYDNWLAFSRVNSGRRAIVAGTGAWLNTAGQGISQLQRALAPDDQGRKLAGVALYAYNQPLAGSSFERRRQFMDELRETVFAQDAIAPHWDWVYAPTRGHLQGIAVVEGQILSDSYVSLIKDGQWIANLPTSYDGWYGAVDLEPGRYNVLVKNQQTGAEVMHEVIIEAGLVTNGP